MRHILFSSLLLIADLSVQAQWVQTQGPYGGYIATIEIHNNDVLAGTEDGVYISHDHGTNWSNNGMKGLTVQCIAASGSDLFAGTNGGFYYSSNNGVTWTASNTGLSSNNIASMVVSGSNLFIGTSDGIYRSANSGGNWTKVVNGLTFTYVTALAVSGSTILAGTQGGGIFISVNNGDSWAQSNSGYTDSYGLSFAVSGSKIFSGSSTGVFLSVDNGVHWSSVSNGLPAFPNISALRVIGGNTYCVVALVGLYKSSNDGTSWEEAGFNNPGIDAFAGDGINFFTGTLGQGVFFSADGVSWNNASSGIANMEIAALTTYNDYLFAGVTKGGVFVSPDFGTTWNSNNNALSGKSVLSLEVDGTAILAGIYGFAGSDGGIYISTNLGSSWTLSGLAGRSVSVIKVVGNKIFAGTDGGVYVSNDHGIVWSHSGLGGLGSHFYSILGVGNGVFISTAGSDGVYASFDNGTTWLPKSSGLPSTGCTSINDLAFKDNKIYATSCFGVYVSSDNGSSWSSVIQGLSGPDQLAVHGENIFMSLSSIGISVSHDNGQNWSPENGGMSNHSILSLATHGDYILAGTHSGIFISPMLSVTGFTPGSGTTGATVSVSGIGFDTNPANNVVQFANNVSANIVTGTATSLTVTVPNDALTGPIKVFSYGQSATTVSNFTVLPTLTGFTPTSGAAGTLVTISGTTFDSNISGNVVRINGVQATVQSASSSSLSILVPETATSGLVSVTAYGQTVTSTETFDVLPTITDFSPKAGAPGAQVIISGTSFSSNASGNTVHFNGTSASVQSASATSVTAVVPINATTGRITITVDGHTATSDSDFIVTPVTGVNEKVDNTVTLYPNPFVKTIIVQSQHEVNIGIFDSMGNRITELHSFKGTIDSESFSPGLYLFRISSGSATSVQKLIKIN